MFTKSVSVRITIFFILTCLGSQVVSAQTTAFTYQGKLNVTGSPANGNYDLEFRLFDLVSGGAQIGTLQTRSNVAVADGIFSVNLDFGDQFPGANRFLDISVRQTGGGAFTPLLPRQSINSTPYAVKSLTAENAIQIGGITSDGFVKNQTTQQATSNFNISGNGTAAGTLSAGVVSATTQYDLGAIRILSSPGTNNLFVGKSAGTANTTGNGNSFFGTSAGQNNLGGNFNSFFGVAAGTSNIGGSNNSFFGTNSGDANTSGTSNSFFGAGSGFSNTNGTDNSFFGRSAGQSNLDGFGNSFFGQSAGFSNTSGSLNSFFGQEAGRDNTSGIRNTIFGAQAGMLQNGSSNAFFGFSSGKVTTGDGNSFFGKLAGESNTSGGSNVFVGSSAGINNTIGSLNSFVGALSGGNNQGDNNSFLGNGAGLNNRTGSHNSALGSGSGFNPLGNLTFATAIGSNAVATVSNRVQIGRVTQDTVAIGAFASPSSSTAVCINATGVFTSCSASSLKYKESVAPFTSGLSILKELRPVTFVWKEDHKPDIGLIAEEVEKIEPLLSTYDHKGNLDGVKYTQLTILLINAVNQQQKQIERLLAANTQLLARIRRVEKRSQKKPPASRRR